MDYGVLKFYRDFGKKYEYEEIKFNKETFSKGKSKDGYLEFDDRPIIEVGNKKIHPLWGLIYYGTFRYLNQNLTTNDFFNGNPKIKKLRTKYGDNLNFNKKYYTYSYIRIYEHKLGDNHERYQSLLKKAEEIEKFINKQIRFFEELEKKINNGEEISANYILGNTLLDKDWFKNTFKTYLLIRGVSFPQSQINDGRSAIVINNVLDSYSRIVIDLLKDYLKGVSGEDIDDFKKFEEEVIKKVKDKFEDKLRDVKDRDLKSILSGFGNFLMQNILGLAGLFSKTNDENGRKITNIYLTSKKEFLKSVKYYIDNYIKQGKFISIEGNVYYMDFREIRPKNKHEKIEKALRKVGDWIFKVLDDIYDGKYGADKTIPVTQKIIAIYDIVDNSSFKNLLEKIEVEDGIYINHNSINYQTNYTYTPIYPPNYNVHTITFYPYAGMGGYFILNLLPKVVWEEIDLIRNPLSLLVVSHKNVVLKTTNIDRYFGNFGVGYSNSKEFREKFLENTIKLDLKKEDLSSIDLNKIEKLGIDEFLKTFLPSPQFWYEDYIKNGEFEKVITYPSLIFEDAYYNINYNPLFRIFYNIPTYVGGNKKFNLNYEGSCHKFYEEISISTNKGLSTSINNFLKKQITNFISNLEKNKQIYNNLVTDFIYSRDFDSVFDVLYDLIIGNQVIGKKGRRKTGIKVKIEGIEKVLDKITVDRGSNISNVELVNYFYRNTQTYAKKTVTMEIVDTYKSFMNILTEIISDYTYPPEDTSKETASKFFELSRDMIINFFRLLLGDFTSPEEEIIRKFNEELKSNGYYYFENKLKIDYKSELPIIIDKTLQLFQEYKSGKIKDNKEIIKNILENKDIHPFGKVLFLVLRTIDKLDEYESDPKMKKYKKIKTNLHEFISELEAIKEKIAKSNDINNGYLVSNILKKMERFLVDDINKEEFSNENPIIDMFYKIYRIVANKDTFNNSKLKKDILLLVLFFDVNVRKIPHINPINHGIIVWNLIKSFLERDFINFIDWYKLFNSISFITNYIPFFLGWVVGRGLHSPKYYDKDILSSISYVELTNIFNGLTEFEYHNIYSKLEGINYKESIINFFNIFQDWFIKEIGKAGSIERWFVENKEGVSYRREKYISPFIVGKNILSDLFNIVLSNHVSIVNLDEAINSKSIVKRYINGTFQDLYRNIKAIIGEPDNIHGDVYAKLSNKSIHQEIVNIIDYQNLSQKLNRTIEDITGVYSGNILDFRTFLSNQLFSNKRLDVIEKIVKIKLLADYWYGLLLSTPNNSTLLKPIIDNEIINHKDIGNVINNTIFKDIDNKIDKIKKIGKGNIDKISSKDILRMVTDVIIENLIENRLIIDDLIFKYTIMGNKTNIC